MKYLSFEAVPFIPINTQDYWNRCLLKQKASSKLISSYFKSNCTQKFFGAFLKTKARKIKERKKKLNNSVPVHWAVM